MTPHRRVETKILTDVFGIELVNANQHTDGRRSQNPSEGRAELGELARMYIVHQETVKLIPSNGSQKKNNEIAGGRFL